MTTEELVEYYQGQLIAQYRNLPKASGMIGAFSAAAIMPQVSTQEITFSVSPSGGTFVLSYNGQNTASIAWNAPTPTIQTDLRALTGLSAVTVSGSIATSLVVTFTGVIPPALSLVIESNLLTPTTTITITETDLVLPLAVQDAFNLIQGTDIAVGNQLDVLAKYVGVTRTGLGFTQSITLDDDDFYTLILMGIAKNSSGSSLYDIQSLLNRFFANQIFVYDSTQMVLTYVLDPSIGSNDLVQLFITEGLLPVPMAVGLIVIFGPTLQFFSFRTYEHANVNGFPFNTYSDYNETWTWLSYQYSRYPVLP